MERIQSRVGDADSDEAHALQSKPTWIATNSTRAKAAIEAGYYMNSPLTDVPLGRKDIQQIIRMSVRGGGVNGVDASSVAAPAQVLQ
ncbi:hypothetical protein DYB32_005266 [Aphanomyces invadans]|uniref:Uncharacterized protein n=1 Tax=Aphanomyces invadans TaxID=157072 RepID=A0A3R7A8I2_9STRA|nr:hypothetical protein DYB32_005266 [Aphanomyces invadans]